MEVLEAKEKRQKNIQINNILKLLKFNEKVNLHIQVQ